MDSTLKRIETPYPAGTIAVCNDPTFGIHVFIKSAEVQVAHMTPAQRANLWLDNLYPHGSKKIITNEEMRTLAFLIIGPIAQTYYDSRS